MGLCYTFNADPDNLLYSDNTGSLTCCITFLLTFNTDYIYIFSFFIFPNVCVCVFCFVFSFLIAAAMAK